MSPPLQQGFLGQTDRCFKQGTGKFYSIAYSSVKYLAPFRPKCSKRSFSDDFFGLFVRICPKERAAAISTEPNVPRIFASNRRGVITIS
jgi:hypothetical protein